MNDADRIVERLVVNHEPRMRRVLKQAEQFAELDVLLDRDDVGAVHHDVGDPAIVQPEDVAQHRALERREAGVVGRAGVEYDLQIVAHRAGLPAEQRTDRTDQPVAAMRMQHFALVHHRG